MDELHRILDGDDVAATVAVAMTMRAAATWDLPDPRAADESTRPRYP